MRVVVDGIAEERVAQELASTLSAGVSGSMRVSVERPEGLANGDGDSPSAARAMDDTLRLVDRVAERLKTTTIVGGLGLDDHELWEMAYVLVTGTPAKTSLETATPKSAREILDRAVTLVERGRAGGRRRDELTDAEWRELYLLLREARDAAPR